MKQITIIFIILFSTILNAQTDILKTSLIYIDKTNKLTINNIDKANFKPSNRSKVNLGYIHDTVWLKFSIANETNKAIKKVLVLDNQMLDHITLFSGGKKEVRGVLNYSNFDEKILDFYFNISLNPFETKNYYLKVSSISCAVYFKLQLMEKEELYRAELVHQLILVLFFGAMVALIIYNIVIYYFTKDLAYVYYTLYLVFTVWYHGSYTGMVLYWTPTDFIEIDTFLAIFYLAFITNFALLFTRELMNIKRYKKIDIVFKLFIVLNTITLIFTTPEFYPIDLVIVLIFLSFLYMIAITFYLYFKGEENTKFIIVGWSIAFIGWFMIATYQYGLFSLIENYPYFYEFTIFTEAILFSTALANKLNKTKELENSLNTSKVLSRELHHRVKNNMMFIISLYRLKLNDELNDEQNGEIDTKLKEVENSIKSISSIHEILYDRDDLGSIDTKEYFTTLLDELKYTYKDKKIAISLDSSVPIDIQKAIYCGLVVNELVTNAFKYAFDTQESGNINISIDKKDKQTILTIKDDGVGYDIAKNSTGFGLVLVKSLVKNELKGEIETINSNGLKYIIKF